jgi:hypothetical protein
VRKTIADPNVVVRSASCPHPNFNDANWQNNEAGILSYFEETIKTVLYYVKY